MLNRCNDSNNIYFYNYGGRGIKVFQEWQDDFMTFFNYIGKRPTTKHTLERLDNNAGYFPGNVKWATRREQANNTRRNIFVTLGEQRLTVAQLARQSGMRYGKLHWRITHGWTPEKAIC